MLNVLPNSEDNPLTTTNKKTIAKRIQCSQSKPSCSNQTPCRQKFTEVLPALKPKRRQEFHHLIPDLLKIVRKADSPTPPTTFKHIRKNGFYFSRYSPFHISLMKIERHCTHNLLIKMSNSLTQRDF